MDSQIYFRHMRGGIEGFPPNKLAGHAKRGGQAGIEGLTIVD